MYRWLRALLFRIPAETAHRLGMRVLRLLGAAPRLGRWTRARATRSSVNLSLQACGLEFPNPLGIAAGLDKNAEVVPGLFGLGFGSIEVGTVTPRAQPGNPEPRLFRIPEHQALINRMGFNNVGAVEVAARLRQLTCHPGPIGANLGKNMDTPIERAVEDYVYCAQLLAPVCDYLVINASSPNTPGLRGLQEPERLTALLAEVQSSLEKSGTAKPLLLKIAPDLSENALDAIVDIATANRIQGLIATNTTNQRPFHHRLSSQPGGLSGAPLRAMATEAIKRLYTRSAGRLTVVGVGGIFTGADAYEKIRAGASWVQIYTSFIYRGPGAAKAILRELEGLLKRDGFGSVTEAIGASTGR